ncbi:transcriptional regulator [Clostridioides difficile]
MDARKKWIPFLGVQVKQKLIELNMTQRELAKKIGVNENYLSAILNGRRTGKKYKSSIYQLLNIEYSEDD